MRRSLSIISSRTSGCEGDEMSLRVMAWCAVLALMTPAAWAQAVAEGVIQGTVVDPMHTVVANADVTISGLAPTTVRTDAAGQFSIAVAEGTYAITVVAPG